MKFQVGDRVKIVENINGGMFETGTIGVISSVSEQDQDYEVSDGIDTWFYSDDELAPYTGDSK